jgi:hypothetical protein
VAIIGPEPLTAAHDVSEFSCGKPSLDRWLQTRALSNQEKGLTAVLVVHEANRVIGYYGLAPNAAIPSSLPRALQTLRNGRRTDRRSRTDRPCGRYGGCGFLEAPRLHSVEG